MFAGWFGQQVMISEITPATAGSGAAAITSFVYYSATGVTKQIDRPMLMPVVDPTGKYVLYWSGTVEFDPSTGLWEPGKGDLYFDAWSNLSLGPVSVAVSAAPATPSAAAAAASASPVPTAVVTPAPTSAPTDSPDLQAGPSTAATAVVTSAPTATSAPASALPQILPVASAPASVHSWIVRWDATGQNVAIWVGNTGSLRIGRLVLYPVDRKADIVSVNDRRLRDDEVLSGIQFADGRLVYTSAIDGKTYMEAVPSVPPSNAETPSPTVPGQLPASGDLASAPASQPTDRPGN